MIYAKLHGRLGNIMFITAAAATLAKQRGDKFCLVCHKDYRLAGDIPYIWDYVQQFRTNILKGIDILPTVPVGIPVIKQYRCSYSKLLLRDKDCVIDGAFQSYKYFDYSVVQKLFNIDSILREVIDLNAEAFSAPITSVHVRRGDYCDAPHKFPPVSCSFIKSAMDQFPSGTRFLFISDDLDYCKRYFHGDNIFYMNNRTILRDLFAPTLCENNIISNSTFTWWGAYLNPNPNKKVIVPTPWFGKYISNRDVSDLIPSQWTQIRNHLEFNLWWKAKRYGVLTRLGIIK